MILKFYPPYKFPLIKFSFFLFLIISFFGCSSSKRFNDDDYNYPSSSKINSPNIGVLLDDSKSDRIILESNVILYSAEKSLAVVNSGNTISVSANGDEITISIAGKNFTSEYFKLGTKEKNSIIFYKGKKFRGQLKILTDGSKIYLVNELLLEDYLRGVLPLEMPIGKDDENYEALKAMTVAARTYSLSKMNKNNKTFDVFMDTRDQVYGGVEVEKEITNKLIDKTAGLILTYNNNPAQVFYSASCGGHTENSKNVFGNYDIPYLEGVQDSDEPYCSIMPGFEWTEEYTTDKLLSFLVRSGKINNTNYKINDINIDSRFSSGRVNKIKFELTSDENDDEDIIISGNNIRSIIRRSNGGILKSTMFDINFNGDTIEINGRGNGHGVGLCQWGTIYLSHEGRDYKEILSHYFPGTEINPIDYDK